MRWATTRWRQAGATLVLKTSRDAPRTASRAPATSGWTPRSRIDIETRLILRSESRWPMTLVGRSGPVRHDRGHRDRIRRAAGSAVRTAGGPRPHSENEYSAYICGQDLPNELMPGISDCPAPERRRLRRRRSPRRLARPTAPPARGGCAVPPGDSSEPIGRLTWTQESLKQDGPAGSAPSPLEAERPTHAPYASGPLGRHRIRCVPLHRHRRGDGRHREGPPQAGRTSRPPWIPPRLDRDGVVIDDDRDGVPDWRYGIDNMPVDRITRSSEGGGRISTPARRMPARSMGIRAVAYGEGTPLGQAPRPRIRTDRMRPSGLAAPSRPHRDRSVGRRAGHAVLHVGVVIVNGRVVATDYAPHAGWLVATPGATPGGTFLLGDPFPDLSMTVPKAGQAMRRPGQRHR